MDRYTLFQQLLTLVADDYNITNAKMKDYSDRIVIEATCADGDIKIEVTISERETDNAADS